MCECPSFIGLTERSIVDGADVTSVVINLTAIDDPCGPLTSLDHVDPSQPPLQYSLPKFLHVHTSGSKTPSVREASTSCGSETGVGLYGSICVT